MNTRLTSADLTSPGNFEQVVGYSEVCAEQCVVQDLWRFLFRVMLEVEAQTELNPACAVRISVRGY